MTKRVKIKTHTITPTLTLIDTQPPIQGYNNNFFGAYLFRSEKSAIVDIGPKSAVPNLLAGLYQLAVQPKDLDFILLTHIHIDHGGGTGTAIHEIKNAKVLAHSRALSHLIDPASLWEGSLKTLGDLAIQYGDIIYFNENNPLKLPSKYEEVCFVSSKDFVQYSISSERYPVMAAAVAAGLHKESENVFLVPPAEHSIYVGPIEVFDNSLEVPYLCVAATKGRLDIKLEGRGAVTRISEI